MNRGLQRYLGCVAFAAGLSIAPQNAGADARYERIEQTYPEHTRAVELGRAGRYDEALAILDRLLADFPTAYPLQRDATLITIWKGDCSGGLRRFEEIGGNSRIEPYLAVPVSDCLLAARRPREAMTVVVTSLRAFPDDPDLLYARQKAEIALRLDAGIGEDRPLARIAFWNDYSDAGNREWWTRVEGAVPVYGRTQLYSRYTTSRARDRQYANGDTNRAGVGVRYRFNERWQIDQEFSTDVGRDADIDSDTRARFDPYDTWRLYAGYTTYAEDIPLRARAAAISADRADLATDYESTNYRWSGRASLAGYDFSDGNRRRSLYASGGYTYELIPQREQRLFVDWYESSNSLEGAPYFNPGHDRAIGVVHRTDFVYDTRFQRHVDHLYLVVNGYWQEGYGTKPRAWARFEQDYDFDAENALVWGVGYFSMVYDGTRENEWRFEAYYRRRF
jgi:biofilm PGA synthesis protein PgaA